MSETASSDEPAAGAGGSLPGTAGRGTRIPVTAAYSPSDDGSSLLVDWEVDAREALPGVPSNTA